MTNAGSVKTAPAAIDSPIEPMVRAMFSSRIEPLNSRSTAMPMMAAGYVAAIVMPARSPRYAFAAPRITVMTRPRRTARNVHFPHVRLLGDERDEAARLAAGGVVAGGVWVGAHGLGLGVSALRHEVNGFVVPAFAGNATQTQPKGGTTNGEEP